MIVVQNRRRKRERILNDYPGATIIDVTSKAQDEFVRLSPFYPHLGIPVPYSPHWTASCVEAIWQGLKVFPKADIDTGLFSNTTMKNLKRSSKKNGVVLGHRKGVNGRKDRLLDYVRARLCIYAPAYKWVLENRVSVLVDKIRELSSAGTVVLLDYETNTDPYCVLKPLSHAGLIKAFIDGTYPEVPIDDVPEETLATFFVGQKVIHSKFGLGVIAKVENAQAAIDFASGRKVVDITHGALEPYDPATSGISPRQVAVYSGRERAILLENIEGLWGIQADSSRKVEAVPCVYEQIVFCAARFSAKQKVPTYYFLVRKDGRWGLLNKVGRQQAPCIYDELTPKESSEGLIEGFAFDRGGVKGLIDGRGDETIESENGK